MKELDRKDTPEVTGGTIGPIRVPVPINPLPLPSPGPEFPPSPLGGPEQPVIETYQT